MITDSNIRLTNRNSRTRPPAVAGMFYPADRNELEKTLNTFIVGITPAVDPPKAIIAPHAGYIYSGPVAAEVYATLLPVRDMIKKVVLLGPAHRVYLKGMALPDTTAFSTPLGSIEIDRELVDKIKKFPQVTVMDSAHTHEHSLEVHLPFLQYVLDEFTLLPLVVGDIGQDKVAEILETVWGGDETLIVISSDLSHYHDYDTARKLDNTTSESIKDFRSDLIGPEQACGCMPMSGLLSIAKRRNMEIKILDVKNSGDTAGSRDRVVGYGAYSVHYQPSELSKHEKELLNIARKSIEHGFRENKPLSPDIDDYDDILREKRATFVTLRINANLRGCIGTIQAVEPLAISIADSAFKAAFKDPRFKPLTEDEFKKADLSISVLSPPVEIAFSSSDNLVEQLQTGIDGLIIESRGRKATFLPEVWESIPSAKEFLNQLKLKAGMAPGETPEYAWRYSTEHFPSDN